jgi:N-acetyl-beta-hexosaminidase
VVNQVSAQVPQILPQPQRIDFGSGSISLVDAEIGFASEPSEEDLFAAEQLAKIIKEKSNISIEIVGTSSDGKTIVFDRTEADQPLPLPGDQPGPDSREAYSIDVVADQVRITSKSSAGLFYAVQTLDQLLDIDSPPVQLPYCTIEDWPKMVYRGFMMDMSHTQFPKMEEIKKQIDFLASWKANQYYRSA